MRSAEEAAKKWQEEEMKKSIVYFALWALSVLVAFSLGLLGGAKVILSMKKAEVAEDAARIAELEREAEQYEEMITSWYGPGFHGRRTANTETFDTTRMTAAHRTLPFGTILLLEYQGRYAVCRINDRGPYVEGRDLDVSLAVARELGILRDGVVELRAKVIMQGRPSVGD